MPQSSTTTTIIVVATLGGVSLVLATLSIWLIRLNRRQQRTAATTRGVYKKLQKRDPSKCPPPDTKHLSISTISTRRSSVSNSDYQQRGLSDLEAQPTEYQGLTENEDNSNSVQPAAQLKRNGSVTSQYSFRPEHFAKGSFQPTDLLSVPRISSLAANMATDGSDAPSRVPSTRIANYHTDAEYSELIYPEITAMVNNQPIPPPPIPHKSSWRLSFPFNIDQTPSVELGDQGTLRRPEAAQQSSRIT